jgi:penicillin-binding protein 1A
MKNFSFFWRKGLWALMSLGFVAACFLAILYIYLLSQLPSVDALRTVELQVPLQIYSQDGELIQEYGEKRRIPLTYDQIPPTLVHAILATEDQRFFEHPGVDILGLGRATLKMVQTGTKSQGGSTITMQVARNFFLDRKKTFWRKFNEILLAIKIDQELPKEKILEAYLNESPYGGNIYGVEAASKTYFNKNAADKKYQDDQASMANLINQRNSQNLKDTCVRNKMYLGLDQDMVLDPALKWKFPDKRPPVCIGGKNTYQPMTDQTALIGTLLKDASNTKVGDVVSPLPPK